MRRWLGRGLAAVPAIIAVLAVFALYLDGCTCDIPDEWEFLTWFANKSWMTAALGAAVGMALAALWKVARRFWKLPLGAGLIRMAYFGACAGIVETVHYVFALRARDGV